MDNKDLSKARAILFALSAVGVLFMILCAIFMTSCTISFNNVSTAGKATDIIDEDQQADPNISPDITIPIKPI